MGRSHTLLSHRRILKRTRFTYSAVLTFFVFIPSPPFLLYYFVAPAGMGCTHAKPSQEAAKSNRTVPTTHESNALSSIPAVNATQGVDANAVNLELLQMQVDALVNPGMGERRARPEKGLTRDLFGHKQMGDSKVQELLYPPDLEPLGVQLTSSAPPQSNEASPNPSDGRAYNPRLGVVVGSAMSIGGGRYAHQEDRVFISAAAGGDERFVFAGVFDGHNGAAVSEYLRRNLCSKLHAIMAEERAYTRRAALLLQRGVLPGQSDREMTTLGGAGVESHRVVHAGHVGGVASGGAAATASRTSSSGVGAETTTASAPASFGGDDPFLSSAQTPLQTVAAELQQTSHSHSLLSRGEPDSIVVSSRSIAVAPSSSVLAAEGPQSTQAAAAPGTVAKGARSRSPAGRASQSAAAFSHDASLPSVSWAGISTEDGVAAVLQASETPRIPTILAPGAASAATHYAPGEPDFRRILQARGRPCVCKGARRSGS